MVMLKLKHLTITAYHENSSYIVLTAFLICCDGVSTSLSCISIIIIIILNITRSSFFLCDLKKKTHKIYVYAGGY
jgi:hypothetical protein